MQFSHTLGGEDVKYSYQNRKSVEQMMLHTDSEADLLLLIGQSVVIVQVKLQAFVLAGQQLPLQAEQNTEVAFTAHQPDGVTRGLQVNSHLRYKTGAA